MKKTQPSILCFSVIITLHDFIISQGIKKELGFLRSQFDDVECKRERFQR